jgi:hypothetical protein
MSAAKHTPGPWEVEDITSQGAMVYRRIKTSKDEPVGSVSAYKLSKKRDAEAEANARLIAAAPELLEALEMMIADFGDYPASKRPCLAFDLARAAIARATGDA